jgi:hypothetical protein
MRSEVLQWIYVTYASPKCQDTEHKAYLDALEPGWLSKILGSRDLKTTFCRSPQARAASGRQVRRLVYRSVSPMTSSSGKTRWLHDTGGSLGDLLQRATGNKPAAVLTGIWFSCVEAIEREVDKYRGRREFPCVVRRLMQQAAAHGRWGAFRQHQ